MLAVSTQHLRGVLAKLPASAPGFLICAKGFELGTLQLPSEVAGDVFPDAPICVLSGPILAAELAAGQPAATVFAGADREFRRRAAAALRSERFRVYASHDWIGAQICGAAKNVIAIAAGIAIGAGFGENARAAVVARDMFETARLVVALGGDHRTVSGLAGAGDIFLTCAGRDLAELRLRPVAGPRPLGTGGTRRPRRRRRGRDHRASACRPRQGGWRGTADCRFRSCRACGGDRPARHGPAAARPT